VSERHGYQPGVPCWVDTWQRDPEAAVGFYTRLFGWQAEEVTPPGSPTSYVMCRLRGRDVAAIGSPPPPGAPATPAWGTYVWVESADETAVRVTEAGGRVVMPPSDGLDAGRVALVADSAGAVLGLWQAGGHGGAQAVNEPGAWSMSLLNTPDVEAATAFYGEVFGWHADTFDMGGVEFTLCRLPGYVGGEPEQPVPRDVVAAMAPMSGDAGVPPHWSIDFWVDDVDAAAGRAADLGGSIVVPPFDTQVGRTAALADPAGAAFLVSRVGPAG